jgi:GTP-binding protein
LKKIDGKTLTPYEKVFIEVPEQYQGAVMQKWAGERRSERNANTKGISFPGIYYPTKGLLGYRIRIFNRHQRLGNHKYLVFPVHARPRKLERSHQGSFDCFRIWRPLTTTVLINVQDRGVLFLDHGIEIYQGQVVGQNSRSEDIRVNVCKTKQLSNMRSKGEGSDEHFNTPKTMDLEDALEYIGDDELVEATPQSVRIRKMYLTEIEAKRAERESKEEK